MEQTLRIFLEELFGYIDSVIFASDETGFTVARLKEPKKRELTTIVGPMPTAKVGETIHCQGVWKHNPQYGRQFQVEKYETKTPEDIVGIQKYLESGLIKGIGPHYAEQIVEEFGDNTLEVIDKTPYRLGEIPGIGRKRIETIRACWEEQKAMRELMIFLQKHGIRTSYAQKIYKTYGDASIETIKENPFALARYIFGIGFASADELAQKLGIPPNAPVRIEAGIEHMLWERSSEGHACYALEGALALAEKLLQVDEELIRKGVTQLEEDGAIIRSEIDGTDYLWVKPLYLAELGIAREINRLKESECTVRSIHMERALDWVEERLGIKLAPEQKTAVNKSLSEKLHIITGGPGTGKSTITNAILTIACKLTDKLILAAPTGRAAKRMSEITRRKASTIHSLLEVDFAKGGFKRDRDTPLDCDMVIVDEASMIDTQLMHSLLKAIPSGARVIFIGDIDQLPSVGPGAVLKDLIASDLLPVTMLKKIFRQAQGSKIVTNAHRVNAGYFPEVENGPDSDFFYIEADDQETILAKTLELVTNSLPRKYRLNPIEDIQVLSPMRRGLVGTENLNEVMQKQLNPQPHPFTRMGRTFHLHDKVMQIRNNYDKKVFNGDVGRLSAIDVSEQEVVVTFDGVEVFYDFSELDELVLAYACSIHKYQGSECPCVIIPIHTSHFKLLFRNLLYTGITRGKRLVILVGSKKAVAMAVNTDNAVKRCTGLTSILKNCEMSHHPSTDLHMSKGAELLS